MKDNLTNLTSQQLVRRLKREKSIDYVALVTSSWHFLAAVSTIKWLKDKKGVRRGLVLVFEHPTDGCIIESELVNRKWFDDLEVYSFKFGVLATQGEIKHYLRKHQKEGREFYILRPVMPKLEFSVMLYNENVRKNIVHIVIEEGLATYMRNWKGWLFEDLHTHDMIAAWNQISMRTWKKHYSEAALFKRGELIQNTLFVKKGKKFVTNRRAIIYFKWVLQRTKYIYDCKAYENYQGSVIVCTQTYGEQKRILDNADMHELEHLVKKLKEEGNRVIIKPHPRERNIDKYIKLGCEVDTKNSVPLESILASLDVKPRCIVGITTTTLITAKLFWDIPAISMARLINHDSYAKEIVGEIDNFCKIFGRVIQIPDNYQKVTIRKGWKNG